MLFPTDSACAPTDSTLATKKSRASNASSKTGLWDSIRGERLQWLPEVGIGFYKVTANPYGPDYFQHYVDCANTDIGRRLNAARVEMLRRHWDDPSGVVDIGIGAGTFVEAVPGMRGYDVNPLGISWLNERGLFVDPYQQAVDVAVFNDSLEHIINPAPLLANVRHRVLVSLPIFRDVGHLMTSKHRKYDEHAWYFTEPGFLWFMGDLGWSLLESNDYETVIGRDGIKSYAFKRA